MSKKALPQFKQQRICIIIKPLFKKFSKEKQVHTQNSYTLFVWFKVSYTGGVWPTHYNNVQHVKARRVSHTCSTHH